MAWDLKIDNAGDLNGEIINGGDEIVQRVKTRLGRFFGEWFLAVTAGLPWYEELLGSKNRQRTNLLVRREILQTEGVVRILKYNPIWDNSTRAYTIFVEILLTGGTVRTFTYTVTPE